MSRLIHRKNFLDVNSFLDYLRNVERKKPTSVGRYRSYIQHLLRWAMDAPLNQAKSIKPDFIEYLENYISPRTGKPLSRESWRKILGITVRFFDWAMQYRSRRYDFSLRFYTHSLVIPPNIQDDPEVEYVSEAEIHAIARLEIPEEDLALRRDQAAACFLYCSAMRVGAFVTMPIMAFDAKELVVRQWKKYGVQTKNGKQITTYLFEIPELIKVILDWDQLVNKRLQPTDAWYPRIGSRWGDQSFSQKPLGENRDKSFNKRMKLLFQAAGLEYKSAHNFRRGNVVAGMEKCEDMSTFKAISENLGHANTTITDQYYGRIKPNDRKEKIANLFKQEGE